MDGWIGCEDGKRLKCHHSFVESEESKMTEYTRFRNKNRGYMTLRVWQKAVDLYKLVCKIVYTDNKIDFKLRAQIADAAQSVSSNNPEIQQSKTLEIAMARPVTLFTGQWADLTLETLAQKAKAWGFDGLELACWGDHFEVKRALNEPDYCAGRHQLLAKYGLKVWAISNHLVGQAVCDQIGRA